MPKNKKNFFETNIIIPKINKKWNSKRKKSHEIVHLIVDISCLVVKCAFQIRFNLITTNLEKKCKIVENLVKICYNFIGKHNC